MLIVERQQKVLAILREQQTAQLEELARALDVSASTIRRDLEQLEERGLVQRTHGGAVFVGDESATPGPKVALNTRLQENVWRKQAIALEAAKLVQPHMTLLLDGGSTVVYTAQAIRARPLQVVTNSLAVANLFADDDEVELLLIGGSLYPRSGVLVGPIATGCLADLHADLLLFSLAGVYGDEAFNINLAMAQVEQVMIQQAARSVLLMDSTKFGRKSLVRVCPLSEVTGVITDVGVDREWRDRLAGRLTLAAASDASAS